jgi:hypothetical protein
MRLFSRKSSVELAHQYKLKAKERILYQQRVIAAHSELKITSGLPADC